MGAGKRSKERDAEREASEWWSMASVVVSDILIFVFDVLFDSRAQKLVICCEGKCEEARSKVK